MDVCIVYMLMHSVALKSKALKTVNVVIHYAFIDVTYACSGLHNQSPLATTTRLPLYNRDLCVNLCTKFQYRDYL